MYGVAKIIWTKRETKVIMDNKQKLINVLDVGCDCKTLC